MNKRISFYVLYKDFNTGSMKKYDVMNSLYNTIFNSNGSLSKKNFYIYGNDFKRKEIKTRDDLRKFIDFHFRYLYSFKCEWEFIALDWPNSDNGRAVKIDVYQQLEPNIDLITDIVFEQIKNKIK